MEIPSMQVRQGYILEKHAVGRVDRYDRIATGRCRRCERGGRVGKYSISKFENILTGSEVGDGIWPRLARNTNVSFPAPPVSVSLPAPPAIVSFPDVPEIVSLPEVPRSQAALGACVTRVL
jgi:hypothetical protein